MKLGITSYAYRWALGGSHPFLPSEFKIEQPLSVFSLIEKVSNLGLEVLQICENISLEMSTEDYRRVGEFAQNRGITLELGAAGMDLSVLDRYVRIADMTGSRLLRVYPKEAEPIHSLVKRIRGYLPVLGDRGLTLAVENSSLCLYTSRQLAKMLNRIDDPLVGACVDVANSLGLLERPLETVKVLCPHVVSLHLKDFCVKRKSIGGFMAFGVPLGKGILDVNAVLNIIEKSGRDPNILLEQWMDRKANIEETLKEEEEWLTESVIFLRSIIQRPKAGLLRTSALPHKLRERGYSNHSP